MNLYDAIFYRKTTKEFSVTKVKESLLDEIKNICTNLEFIDNSSDINAYFIERGHLIQLLSDKKCVKSPHYILLTSKSTDSLIDVGFVCEDIILKLTVLGVATSFCEVNFSYDDVCELILPKGEINDEEDEEDKDIKPCILIALGYSNVDSIFREKDEKIDRKPFKSICRKINKKYDFLLSPLQLSPSYKNLQPWVIYNEGNRIDIYFEKHKKISDDLLKLSVGAFMKHFDLAISENNKKCEYKKVKAKRKLGKEYLFSAIINNDVDISR